jgi:hypothetical protein
MRGFIAYLVIGILAAGAGHVAAQDCSMIVLFEDDGELVDQIVTDAGLINAHLVLFSDVAEVGAFEATLEIGSPVLVILAVAGPNGFTNFGSPQEIVAGYTTPLPVQDQAILVSIQMLLASSDHVMICVTGASFVDGDGVGHSCQGLCSEINPVVANEAVTFGAIKRLFE